MAIERNDRRVVLLFAAAVTCAEAKAKAKPKEQRQAQLMIVLTMGPGIRLLHCSSSARLKLFDQGLNVVQQQRFQVV